MDVLTERHQEWDSEIIIKRIRLEEASGGAQTLFFTSSILGKNLNLKHLLEPWGLPPADRCSSSRASSYWSRWHAAPSRKPPNSVLFLKLLVHCGSYLPSSSYSAFFAVVFSS